MINRTKGWGLCLLLGISLTCSAQGQEWTRFRGPNGQGISDARTIPVKWTEKDYNWKVKLPAGGHGSPVWVNGLLYCINRQGEILVLKAAPAYELLAVNPLGEKSQATPAVAGGKMYLRTYSHLISIRGRMQ